MTDVVAPAESVDAPKTPAAGKRDVWIVFWIVPAFYTAFGVIFFALTRTMPPPRPDITTDQMVLFFQNHGTTIQVGFGLLILIVGGAGIANGIVMYHMKRMSTGSALAYFAFAIAILYDRNEIFPKWLAYISVWQIVTELLAVPVFVSKAGPFAWNGSISFWMGTVVFGVWLSCVIMFLKKATELEPVDSPPLD
jgi:hypothetical protein